jgi:hypothetical protein
MTCTCAFGFCDLHPKCPWCGNYTTVFASSLNGAKSFSCTRCKKSFTRKTVVNPPSTSMASKDKTMTKTSKTTKTVKAVKSNKASKKTTTEPRESSLRYEFLKMPKDAPAEDTLIGCVLSGARKAKRGSIDDMTEAAVRCGLNKVTTQDPRAKTRIILRQLANDGAVRITRDGAEKKDNGKKSFKLVKK